ncbi:Hexadecenal dehydrogenase [Coemansia sp. RSA 989]|nr:Hexadecenal dehydrogenase [Coemansia sp. RSA 1086]KAJ1751485.1 Hexadecenal dehydrogenase [Coemansia sp. RSA 1821]KAJ1866529.1 Hexadecenal dehydrogenase [Coemansia sp. RSA 989]KAJ1873823.1 Hexadecenal dehydrogenase [Coemansia sp. RSA 990]KAJ2648368.1 Hexadecenal dehydrogenase [Coemansia sp. RSA 1250]KAJ2670440.1 Hexadecenal dehydrogenase [Coemansia sp. RSA 1085]
MGESKEHTSVTGELGDSSLVYTPVGEIEEIFRQVRKGYVEGAVRSFEQRKHHLRQFLRGLLEEKAALLDAVYFDIHKPHGETELFEFGALEYEIGLFLDNMEKWARPERNPMGSEQPAFLLSQGEVRKEPRGTVVVVGAWNFPVRILLLPVVGALAAGNTVVIKPSELSPHTAQVVGRVIKHVDPQVMRVVQGGVEETTELLRHKFDHYFYTGNGRVGKIVAHAAAEHHAIVTLELGGKSPAVVHADVGDLKPTAARIMWAKLSNAGQTCVGVDYLLVHRSIKDKLVPLLIDAAIGMFGKSPVKSPDFGRIVNERHWNRLMKLLKSSQGNLIQITDDDPNENDRFIPPVLVDGVRLDDSLMSEELFGPILPIITFDTLDEAIEIVNSGDKPLALYVFAQNQAADYVLARAQSGTATVNDTMLHLASHTNPFGGIGSSGVGNYTAKYSFDTFSHHRYVLKRPLWFPTPGIDTVRMPPFTGSEHSWKTQLGVKMVYPKPRSLRSSFLSKLFTFIPFWRILAIIPGFIYALITTKSIFHRSKSEQ